MRVASEYDPVFASRRRDAPLDADLEAVRALFSTASRAYLSSAIPWLGWALLLPAGALATPAALAGGGYPAVLGLWSATILLGGAVEAGFLLRGRRTRGRSGLGGWAMTLQGNLSLVAVALSGATLVAGAPQLLPGIWLLLLGHSLFGLGSLAFRPQRTAGILYQLGGLAALVPGLPSLAIFAATTCAGNLWIAFGVARRGDEE